MSEETTPFLNYKAPKTLWEWLNSQSRKSLCIGPVGCVSCDTEFLGKSGWTRMDQWNGEQVCQYDINTGKTEFVTPLDYIVEPSSELIEFNGFMQLSLEHNVIFKQNKKDIYKKESLQSMLDKQITKFFIPTYLETSHIGRENYIEDREINTYKVVRTSDGFKYCFEVPSHNLLFRRNGIIFISGNSGKSTAFAIKCFMIASKIMKDPNDGIRKSRIGITRNTESQLIQTVIPNFLQWFPPDGKMIKYYKKESKMVLEMGDIYTEWYFIPLDKAVDVKRLLSLNVTAYGFDEFREINKEIYLNSYSRVGRYPPTIREGNKASGKILWGPYDDNGNDLKEVFAVSNPPNEGSFYGDILLNPPEDTEVFWQPGGLSVGAENISHLPENYYEDLMVGKSTNFINVNIHAKLGQDKAGLPVYQGFIPEFHVSEETLQPDYNSRVIVGMDFGLNPSAVFMQRKYNGQLVVLDEITTDGVNVESFLTNYFLPLKKEKYFGMDMLILGDPTGVNRAESDGNTSFLVLKNKGLKATQAPTNNPIARVGSVEQLLNLQVEGEPKLLLSNHLRWLIAGFRGGYKYKKRVNKEGEDFIAPKPDKGKFSHIHDALQYACLYWNNPAQVEKPMKRAYTPSNKPKTRWGDF